MEMQWKEAPPREKLLAKGAAELSDVELLALFLRTGAGGLHVMALAQQLLDHFGSLYQLMTAEWAAFADIKGIGHAKYAQLSAIVELARRFFTCTHVQDGAVAESTTNMLYYFHSQLAHREREIFMVVFLNNQHHVIHSCEMFAGTLNCVEVHPREVAKAALEHNAAALVLAHNHPSGHAKPSKADHMVTRQIVAACQLLNIQVLDHIIIGRGESVSFAERGWL